MAGARETLMLRALAVGVAICIVAGSAPAQEVDTSTALGALRDARLACELDAGAMWGRSLCGPVALVERGTRLVISNDTVAGRAFIRQGDAFIGVLPSGLPLANTSFLWAEQPWAMVILPLPDERLRRVALILHESFHREQEALGLRASDPPAVHLDERDGRLWLRMELRALAAALEADGAAARRHATDALAFRAMRAALFPGADTLEAMLERHEGLAEYTGLRMAMHLTGAAPCIVAEQVRAMESRPSYVRAFAYATGPALGFLLDRHSPRWREAVLAGESPAVLLARALGYAPPSRLRLDAEKRAARYGFAVVRSEEERRHSERTARLALHRARLVEGSILVLTQSNLGTMFDPNAMVPLGEHGTVYPTGTFTAAWGKLEVTGGAGALVSRDFSRVSVVAPTTLTAGEPIVGDGWTLELAPGWTIAPAANRAGSYEVRRRE